MLVYTTGRPTNIDNIGGTPCIYLWPPKCFWFGLA